MSFILQPWQQLLLALAGWINRRQQQKIEYLITENQVLKEKLGKKRIILNDDQRSRLAVKGKILGRKLLEEIATIKMPDLTAADMDAAVRTIAGSARQMGLNVEGVE